MTYNPYNNNTVDSDRRSNVSSFYRGRKESFDGLTTSAGAGSPIPGQDPQTRQRDSFFDPASGAREGSTRGGRDNLSIADRYSRPSFEAQERERKASLTSPTYPNQTHKSGTSYYEDEAGFNPYSGDTASVSRGHGGRPSMGSSAPLVHSPPADGEDQGWDVFNDFNNAGPRYSDAFGGGIRSLSSGYTKLPPQTPSIRKGESDAGLPDGVELVTVPALGPDWKKSEIEGMRSATHRAEKWDAKKQAMTEFWRDQKKCCGLSRKVLAFVLFALCCVVAIALAITIPRVPGFSFNSQQPLSNDTHASSPPSFSRTPANFTFSALLNIQIDTHSNVIPLHVSSLHADVYDLNTDIKVGEGDIPKAISIGAKQFKDISVPVVFDYVATNASDQTWLDFHSACQNKHVVPQGVRPGFNLRVVVMTKITGLLHTVIAATSIDKVACPFELPTNAP